MQFNSIKDFTLLLHYDRNTTSVNGKVINITLNTKPTRIYLYNRYKEKIATVKFKENCQLA